MAQASAVIFGAGAIGRGFLAQLLSESGLAVVFVDVQSALIDALNRRGEYAIEIVGEGAQRVAIPNVRALHLREAGPVAEAVSQAAIVGTAVGANGLPEIARLLALGLTARQQSPQAAAPLNLLICENLPDAAQRLRQAVQEHLPTPQSEQGGEQEPFADAIFARTGFVQAVVSRMVPVPPPVVEPADRETETPLTVRAEAYKRLPIDAGAIVGALPPLIGVEPVTNFAAHVARKLFVHNGAHAVLGYLGDQAGFAFGYEALADDSIRAALTATLAAVGEALIRRYDFAPDAQAAHVADLLRRFENRDLGDSCRRLARDPLRKLAFDDRLVGAARLCENEGVPTQAFAPVIAAALRYADANDPSACQLQQMRLADGLDETLARVCGIAPGEPLAEEIKAAFQAPPLPRP